MKTETDIVSSIIPAHFWWVAQSQKDGDLLRQRHPLHVANVWPEEGVGLDRSISELAFIEGSHKVAPEGNYYGF